MSQIDAIDSSNPYKNKLRNAKKKLSDIEALENSGKPLDEAQQQKVKSKKKVEKEVKDIQESYDNWTKEQISALQQQQAKGAPKQAEAKKDKQPAPKQQQQAKQPEAKKEKPAAAKQEETPAQQQKQKQEAVKAEKQPAAPAKQTAPAKQAAPAQPAQPVEIDDSLNPYKNSVRNAKKKLQDITKLESLATLDEAQSAKLKTKKKVEKELADAQANYDQWVAAQRQALEQSTKPAKAEKQAKPQQQAAKQEQKPQAKQAQQPAKAEQPKQQQAAAKPAAKKEAAPAKQAAPAKPAKPAASEEEVKSAKNKLRNLEKKLKQIEELKAKDKGSLSQEQKDKIAAEKKTKKEYDDAEAQLKRLTGEA